MVKNGMENIMSKNINSEIKVTVIMSAYNHAQYVENSIKSVFNQTYENYKFVVADDASTDDTLKVLMKYEDRIDEIHVYQSNSGYGRGRELIRKSDTQYTAIINSDDSWDSGKLEKQVTYMEAHPECGACFTWCDEVDDDGRLVDIQMFKVNNRTKEEWMLYFWKNGNCLAHPSILIRTDVYQKLCEKNINVFRQIPDFYMWLQLVQNWEIHIIEESLVKFRHHKKNQNVSAFTAVNCIRTDMENEYIWYKIIKEMDDTYFKKAFQSMLINPDAESKEELLCEKFFILCISPVMATQSAAVLFFYDIFENPKYYQVLTEKYGYTAKMFYEQEMMMGKGKYQLELLQENSRLSRQ